MKTVYLDAAASTPLLPQVKDKLLSVLPIFANPSSLHEEGAKANNIIQEAREAISHELNCYPQELYFTSGATMSNNQAIQGFLKKHLYSPIIISSLEHDDIHLMLEDYPVDLKYVLPCEHKTGRLDFNSLIDTLDKVNNTSLPVLVSIQWANNETGVIQNMRQIGDIVNSYPYVYLHTDATQYIAHNPISLHDIGIDMLSCSAQKIGGLKGTGLLYVRENVELSPIIYGDQGLIGGTENVPGIACIGEAIKQLDYSNVHSIAIKRDYLYEHIKNLGELVGSLSNRLPNNLCMIFKGIRGEELQNLLSELGVYVSTGSACSSHIDEPSKTLTAMGYSIEEANASIRFTLEKETTYEDLDYAIKCINQCVSILKNK